MIRGCPQINIHASSPRASRLSIATITAYSTRSIIKLKVNMGLSLSLDSTIIDSLKQRDLINWLITIIPDTPTQIGINKSYTKICSYNASQFSYAPYFVRLTGLFIGVLGHISRF